MKLTTSIKPRRDGTVTLAGKDGKPYVFVDADGSGELTCEIEHEATLTMALASGNFNPTNLSDVPAATKLLDADVDPEDEDPEDDDPEDEDPEIDMNAAPVEANTPPAALPRKARKPRASAAH